MMAIPAAVPDLAPPLPMATGFPGRPANGVETGSLEGPGSAGDEDINGSMGKLPLAAGEVAGGFEGAGMVVVRGGKGEDEGRA